MLHRGALYIYIDGGMDGIMDLQIGSTLQPVLVGYRVRCCAGNDLVTTFSLKYDTWGHITGALPSCSLCVQIFQPSGTDLSPLTKLGSGVIGRIMIFPHLCPVFVGSNLLEIILGAVFALGFLLAGSFSVSSRGLFSAGFPIFFFLKVIAMCYLLHCFAGTEKALQILALVQFHFPFSHLLDKWGQQPDACSELAQRAL